MNKSVLYENLDVPYDAKMCRGVYEGHIGVSQIPNVALIVISETVCMDTQILRTLSLSEF